jgi:hypothetical protein
MTLRNEGKGEKRMGDGNRIKIQNASSSAASYFVRNF